MDSDVFTDQGGLPVHGIRDVRSTVDGKQHDWSEQAEPVEINTLSNDLKSYSSCSLSSFVTVFFKLFLILFFQL